MIKASAVICECNPMHLGHEYIFANAKKTSDCVVAIMSGNFVQRAENAVFDKYTRAEALCRCGVDLVVELPFPWCSASAEYFASAGVRLADAVEANPLVFGALQKDTSVIKTLAEMICAHSEGLRASNRTEMNNGAALIRENYLAALCGEEVREMLRSPNDILAIEYCKAILQQNLSMAVQSVPRISEKEISSFRSATSLRASMLSDSVESLQPHVPPFAYDVFQREWRLNRFARPQILANLEFHHFRMNQNSLTDSAEGSGGVLERLRNAAADAGNSREMFELAATKKYTNARFRRAALFSLLRVSAQELAQMPLFTVVLAANRTGCAYLAQIRKTAKIQVITKPSDVQFLSADERRQYDRLCEADRLFTLCMQEVQPADFFMKKSPWIYRCS